jgi:hypothetical protein
MSKVHILRILNFSIAFKTKESALAWAQKRFPSVKPNIEDTNFQTLCELYPKMALQFVLDFGKPSYATQMVLTQAQERRDLSEHEVVRTLYMLRHTLNDSLMRTVIGTLRIPTEK